MAFISVNVNSYTKNLMKSFGYISTDLFKSYAPTLSSLAKSSKEAAETSYQAIKDFTSSSSSSDFSFVGIKEKGGEIASNVWKNTIEDIKSGKIYNKERNDALDSEIMKGMGLDFDFDFDLDDWGDNEVIDEDEEAKAQVAAQVEGSKAIINAVDAMGRGLSASMTEATVESASYIAKSASEDSAALFNLNKAGYASINKALMSVNETIYNFSKIGEPLTAHMQNATLFYTKAEKSLNNIEQSLKEIEKNTKRNDVKGSYSYEKSIIDFFTDEGLDFEGIKDNIKTQFDEYKELVDMLMGFTGAKSVTSGGAKNISLAGWGGKLGLSLLIPNIMKESLKGLDESLKYGLQAGFTKLSKGQTNNELINILSSMFLPQVSTKKTLSLKNYQKGSVSWDGIARKALTDVIPTTLLEIYSAITGAPSMRYDYNSGKFVTTNSILASFDKDKKRYVRESGGDLFEAIEKKINESNNPEERKKKMDELYKYFEKSFDSGEYNIFGKSNDIDPEVYELIKKITREKLNSKNKEDRKILNKLIIQSAKTSADYANNLQSIEADGNSIYTAINNGFQTKNNGDKGIIGVDKFGHDYFFYLQGIWQSTYYLASNIGHFGNVNSSNSNSLTSPVNLHTTDLPTIPINATPPTATVNNTSSTDTTYAYYDIPTNETEESETEENKKKFSKWVQENISPKYNKFINKVFGTELKTDQFFVVGLMDSISDSIDRLLFGNEDDPSKGLLSYAFDKMKDLFKNAKDWFKDNIFDKLKESFQKHVIEPLGESSWVKETKKTLSKIGKRIKGRARKIFFGDDVEEASTPNTGTWGQDTSNDGPTTAAEAVELAQQLMGKAKGNPTGGSTGNTVSLDDLMNNASDFYDNGSAAYGRKVTKSGVVTVSEGELIIPSELNPFYHGVTNKAAQIAREKRLGGGIPGYAGGGTVSFDSNSNQQNDSGKGKIKRTIKNASEDSIVGILRDAITDAISGLKEKIDDMVDDKKIDADKKKITDKIEKIFSSIGGAKGEIGAGAVIGAGASLFTGGVINPILGAAVGAGVGFLTKSKEAQDFLFGPEDQNGERKHQKAYDFITKEIPGAGTGAALGLVAGSFVGSPVLGAFLGAAGGFLSSSTTFKKWLFGDKDTDNGVIPKDLQDKTKKALIMAGVGAAAGAILGPIGPLGAVGTILLGSSLGFSASVGSLNKTLFGTPGDRENSIMYIVKEKIFGGIDNIFHNMTNRFKIWSRELAKHIRDKLSEKIDKIKLDAKDGKGGLLTRILGKTFSAGDWLLNKVVKAPFSLVGGAVGLVDDRIQKGNLKKGYGVYNRKAKRNMTAEERIKTRTKYKIGVVDKNFDKFDKFLSSIDDFDELNYYKRLFETIKTEPEDSDDYNLAIDELTKDVKFNQYMKMSSAKKLSKFLKKNSTKISSLISDEANREDASGNKVFTEEQQAKMREEKKINLIDKITEYVRTLCERGVKIDPTQQGTPPAPGANPPVPGNPPVVTGTNPIYNSNNWYRPVDTGEFGSMDISDIMDLMYGKNRTKFINSDTEIDKEPEEKKNEIVPYTTNALTGDIIEMEVDEQGKMKPNMKDKETKQSIEKINSISKGLASLSKLNQIITNGFNSINGNKEDEENKNPSWLSKIFSWAGSKIKAAKSFLSSKFGKVAELFTALIASVGTIALVTNALFGREDSKFNKVINAIGEKLGWGEASENSEEKNGNPNDKGGTKTQFQTADGKIVTVTIDKNGNRTYTDSNGNPFDPKNLNSTSDSTNSEEKTYDSKGFLINNTGTKSEGGTSTTTSAINPNTIQVNKAGKDTALTAFKKTTARQLVTGKSTLAGAIIKKGSSKLNKIPVVGYYNNKLQTALQATKTHILTTDASLLGEAAEKSVKEASDNLLSGTGKSSIVYTKIKDVFDSILTHVSHLHLPAAVTSKLPGCFDDIVENIAKQVGNIEKAGAKFLQEFDEIIPVLNYIMMVVDFNDGYNDARTTLGITKEPTMPQRIISGFIRLLKNKIPLIGPFIPDDLIVNIFCKWLAPVFGLKDSELMKERQEAKAEVNSYNSENGTNYTVAEYNKAVLNDYTLTERFGNMVRTTAQQAKDKVSGVKSAYTEAGGGIKGIGAAIKDYVGVDYIKQAFTEGGGGINGVFEATKTFFNNIGPGYYGELPAKVIEIWQHAFKGEVTDLFKTGFAAFTKTNENQADVGMLTGLLGNHVLTVFKLMAFPVSLISAGIRKFVDVESVLEGAKKLVSGGIEALGITNAIESIKEGNIVKLMSFSSADGDDNGFVAGVKTVTSVPIKLVAAVPTLLSGIGQAIWKKITPMIDKVKETGDNIKQGFLDGFDNEMTGSKVENVFEATDDEGNPLSGFQKGILLVGRIAGGTFGLFAKAGSAIIDKVKTIAEKVKNSYTTFTTTSIGLYKNAITGDPLNMWKQEEMNTDPENPVGGITKGLLFIEKLMLSPMSLTTFTIRKSVVEPIIKTIGLVKGTITLLTNRSGQLMTYVKEGNPNGLLQDKITDEEGNPIRGFAQVIDFGAKVITYPFAEITRIGKKIKEKFDSITEKVSGTMTTVVDIQSQLQEYSNAGNIEGVMNAEIEVDSESPVAGIASGVIGGVKLITLIPTLVHNIGDKIKEKFNEIKDPIIADKEMLEKNQEDINKHASSGELLAMWAVGVANPYNSSLSGIFDALTSGSKIIGTITGAAGLVGHRIKGMFEAFTKDISSDFNSLKTFQTDLEKYASNGNMEKVVLATPNLSSSPLSGLFSFAADALRIGAIFTGSFNWISSKFKNSELGKKIAQWAGLDTDSNTTTNTTKASSKSNKSGGASGLSSNSNNCVNCNFQSQLDPRYKDISFGSSTVGDVGCAPAVATMASKLNGGSLDMDTAINNARAYTNANGTSVKYFEESLNASQVKNTSAVKTGLKSGIPMILLGRDATNKSKEKSPFGPNNHYVLATAMQNGKVLVYDPESNGPRAYDESILDKSTYNLTYGSGSKRRGKGSNKRGKGGFSDTEDAQQIWAYLTGTLGFTEAGAAGLMGCWAEESSNSPNTIEGYYLPGYPGDEAVRTTEGLNNYTTSVLFPAYDNDGISIDKEAYKGTDGNYYPGFGLAQWTGTRGQALHEYANTSGSDWYTLDNQLKYLSSEMSSSQYSDTAAKLRADTDVNQATEDAMRGYEGNSSSSYLSVRQPWANQIYSTYSGKNYTYNGTSTGSNTGTSSSSSDDTSSSSDNNLLSKLSSIFGSLGNIFSMSSFSLNSTDSSSSSNSSSGGVTNAKGAQAAATAAENEIGYPEEGENITKFGKWSGCDGLPWCAAFSAWAIAQAFDGQKSSAVKALYNCDNVNNCPNLVTAFKNANAWYDEPEVGDEVLYSDTGDDDADHVGIVTSVDKANKTFISVEGNSNNQVSKVEHSSYKDGIVYGFGRPDYTGASATIASNGNGDNDATLSGDDNYSATGSGLRGGSSGILRKAAPSRYAYGKLKGQKFKYGGSSGLTSGNRFGSGSNTNVTKTVTNTLTNLKKNLTGGLNNNGYKSSGSIDAELVESLLASITSLLNSIANNTAPTEKIYSALVEYIDYVKSNKNTTSTSKSSSEKIEIPKSNDEIDSNLAGLVSTLAAIARG